MGAALIFDMDGVLLESEEVWHRVRGAVVARHGGTWTEADQHHVMGDNSRQWSAYIKHRWNLPLTQPAIFEEVLEGMIEAYREHLSLLPGAVAAVQRFSGAYPLAVASSSPRALIDSVLESAGIRAAFQVTVSSDEVERGKPAPDVYLLAARQLRAMPQVCVAVEDSANGIRSAAAAGMITVAVPSRSFPPAPEALSLAAAVVPSLHALTRELLAQLIGDTCS